MTLGIKNNLLKNNNKQINDFAQKILQKSKTIINKKDTLYSLFQVLQKKQNNFFIKFTRLSREIVSLFDYTFHCFSHLKNLPTVAPEDTQVIQDIKQEGVSVTSLEELSLPFTEEVLKATEYLVSEFTDNSSKLPVSEDYMSALSHLNFIDPITIAKNFPEVVQWGLQPRILNLVENIIGVPSACVGLIIRKEVLNNQQIGTRLWHLDGEDHQTVKIIVYLNDVTEESGPFQYIPRSSTPRYLSFWGVNLLSFAFKNTAMEKLVPTSEWKTCTGKKGTVIIANTSQIFHSGKLPQRDRYALIYSYTSRKPKRAADCKLETFRQAVPYLESDVFSDRQLSSIYDYDSLIASDS